MKFLTKEVKIGLTGIIAIVILYFGISFLKGIKFSPSHNYFIKFANAKGLAASSPVYADGYQIGIVRNINYDFNKPGEVVVEITVDDDVRMPVGTKAALAEGMLGGCTLNLTMGTNPKMIIEAGDTIIGSDDDGLMAQAAKLLPEVQKVLPEVTQVLHDVDSLINTLNKVAGDPNIGKTIENAQMLTANLNNSTQQLNKLMQNDLPKLVSTFDQAGKNVTKLTGNLAELDMQQTLDKVNQTIDGVQDLIKLMENPNGNLGKLLKDTAIYQNLNNTINSANNLLIDLQAHPKRYVHFSVFGKKDK